MEAKALYWVDLIARKIGRTSILGEKRSRHGRIDEREQCNHDRNVKVFRRQSDRCIVIKIFTEESNTAYTAVLNSFPNIKFCCVTY